MSYIVEDDIGGTLKFPIQPLIVQNYIMRCNDMEIMLRGKGLRDRVSLRLDTVHDQSADTVGSNTCKKDMALAYIMIYVDVSCKSSVMML